MKAFSRPDLCRALLQKIRREAEGLAPFRIMEVCGTHTMAIGAAGIRRLLPENIRLVSGPGCPVCVTPADYIDNAAGLALDKGITLFTFGDLLRVPGLRTSLEQARSEGADIRIITSPADLLSAGRESVLLALGFETTAAPIAAVLHSAVERGAGRVSFYTSIKVVPPTLDLLLADSSTQIGAFLLPGHVSAVIGASAYRDYPVPSIITGFEPLDILQAVLRIVEMKREGRSGTENLYTRVVPAAGNPKIRALFDRYFRPTDAPWRGLGGLPGCSLEVRPAFSAFNAEVRYGLPALNAQQPGGCACGEILKGVLRPDECPLFARACTPENPRGPCMVSSEGSCAAFYRYERTASCA